MELCLTFDDVLLVPQYSEVTSRKNIDLSSNLTKNIKLKIPLISSNMDTVTEDKMAIAMAMNGGIGIIHRFLGIDEQVDMVKKVKRYKNYSIKNPYTIKINDKIIIYKKLVKDNNVKSYPVIDSENNLVGMITGRDVLFSIDEEIVETVMTPFCKLIWSYDNITLDEAYEILKKHRKEKLPLINQDGKLTGLVTIKDLLNYKNNLNIITFDDKGRLRVGAAVGIKPEDLTRCQKLIEAEVDILVVDVAHGHSILCGNMVKEIKKKFPQIEVIAGNVATAEGTKYLIDSGADAIKVNIGEGCLVSDTKILMSNGSYKKIIEIQQNDYIINMNGQPVQVKHVICTGKKQTIGIKTNSWDEWTYVTPDHKFLTYNNYKKIIEWMPIGEIDCHDKNIFCLLPNNINFNKKNMKIVEKFICFNLIKKKPYKLMNVYDLEVDCSTHSFIANNSIVHNSICTTRIMTGCGVPQLTALIDCVKEANKYGIPIISDGGNGGKIGNIVKALATGASTVMLGNFLAGTDESPGKILVKDNKKVKYIRGMSGYGANLSRKQLIDKKDDLVDVVPEGVDAYVPYKGSVKEILFQICGGMRSGLSYCGCNELKNLPIQSKFIRISDAGRRTSDYHGVNKI